MTRRRNAGADVADSATRRQLIHLAAENGLVFDVDELVRHHAPILRQEASRSDLLGHE